MYLLDAVIAVTPGLVKADERTLPPAPTATYIHKRQHLFFYNSF